MPFFDGRGPRWGGGPGAGWGVGPCGFGMGCGFSRLGGWFRSPAQDRQALAQYRQALEEELKAIQDLEASQTSKK